jgi:hypothetical protein
VYNCSRPEKDTKTTDEQHNGIKKRTEAVRNVTGTTSSYEKSGESSSFLVRMWREPQATGEGPVRVYLRNLQTGEELYLGDPARVGEVLSHEVPPADQEETSGTDQTSTAKAG